MSWLQPEVGETADEKLLMTNTSHEPEDQRPQKRVRIILAREVCTTLKETAKLLHRAIMDAVAELRSERDPSYGGADSMPPSTSEGQ